MSKKDTITIRLKLSLCRTDPTPYKVYAPEFEPQGVYVDVYVPLDPIYVARADEGDGETILTPEGMAYLMAQLSNAISSQYNGE